jgi:ubiquinone/menaquinone biosynthesis C-methylase UbiE
VRFWVPELVAAARIERDQRVLDVGCGTGGFSRAIAETTVAAVTGLDSSARFIAFARKLPPPRRGAVAWVVGDAQELPFPPASFDRVLLSLVLHQLPDPERSLAEAWRVLGPRGLVLVRTIAPEDARERVPERFLPSMARPTPRGCRRSRRSKTGSQTPDSKASRGGECCGTSD